MKCGLGVRPELFASFFAQRPDLGFIEAHSENYFGESLARAKLLELREHYPVSLHGVGLSLGRADDLNLKHLAELKSLVNEVEPFLVSEHLAWSAYSHQHLPDLLPLPLTDAALGVMCEHIDQMQTVLGREILLENPSNYLLFDQLQIPEPEFLNEIATRTGCGLLIDLNNVYVSAQNLGRDPIAYLSELNSGPISQYHLAGHTPVTRAVDGREEMVLIDTHNQPVTAAVWELYDRAISLHGAKPTLLEWDSDFPQFEVLLDQCEIANQLTDERPIRASKLTAKQVEPKNDTSSLAKTQESFLTSVTQRDVELLTAEPGFRHRLGIYQNNVFAACQDYLAEVYPATQGVLGEQFFKQLVQSLIESLPPSTGNIALYGEQLRQHAEQLESLKAMPYLDDLMQVEWAIHRAYFARISNCVVPSSMPQQSLLELSVELNDSVRIIKSDYPILEIRRQSLPSYTNEVSIDLNQGQDTILVFKLLHEVKHQALSAALFDLLSAIKESENLLQAIDTLTGSLSAEELSTALEQVFAYQLLAAGNAD